MEKCQYKPAGDLPPVAKPNEIEHVKCACDLDKARLGDSARRYACSVWRVHESQLRGAIIAHIDAGRRMFQKRIHPPGRYIHIEANVTLFDDLDIYVDIALMPNGLVTIYAHNHSSEPRLPQ